MSERMKYTMRRLDPSKEWDLTLFRYDEPARSGSDNAHREFWNEIEALREDVARLREEYVKLFRLAEPIAKMLTELMILPIGCSREQELAWKMAVKNFRHYQRDYAVDALLQAALTQGKGGENG